MVDVSSVNVNGTAVFGRGWFSASGHAGPQRVGRDQVKRSIDVVGAAVLLVLFGAPIAALLAIVAIAGGRPLYGHARVGRGGRRFRCWKIRTMVPDADQRLEAILAEDVERAAEWQSDHKLREDPRVTRIGRVLRRLSLDELPQLWNVLIGEMSLVGPRPITKEELVKYGADVGCYLALRPGVTGLWQVEGRSDVPYARRVELDRLYAMQHSIAWDLALLCRTPFAVFRRTGC